VTVSSRFVRIWFDADSPPRAELDRLILVVGPPFDATRIGRARLPG
jgi:hypothetical protein